MILLVGQYTRSILSELDRLGEPYTVAKDVKRYNEPGAIDFSNADTLRAWVNNLSPRPAFAFAMYEQYIPICARINAWLGAAHALPTDVARRCTDKILMRQTLSTIPDASPKFAEITDREQAIHFAKSYGFPVVLKPANLSKSMLVTICRNLDELEAALVVSFASAPTLYQKYTLGQQPRFIIEEFVSGSTHTVAAFTDRLGRVAFAEGIVDNTSAQQIGYNDSFIFSRCLPSKLTTAEQASLYECAENGITALGIRSCPAHVELILSPDGPRIIEIGARIGGYRQTLYNLACGYDLTRAALVSYRGNLPDFTQSRHNASAVLELFPRFKGAFRGIENLTLVNNLPSLASLNLAAEVGETIGRSAEGYKAAASIILSHVDRTQLEHDIRAVRDNVAIAVTTA